MVQCSINFFDSEILTTVTSYASDVVRWIRKMQYIHRFRLDCLVVGVGVQWRPTFRKAVRPRPATLQLCIGRHCLIFTLIHADHFPRQLQSFLSNRRFTFVGIGINYDAFLLRSCGLFVSNRVELRLLAAEKLGMEELRRASMETLASRVLEKDGVEKPMRISMSRWDRRWLTMEQIRYACTDSHVAFEIGRQLRAWMDHVSSGPLLL